MSPRKYPEGAHVYVFGASEPPYKIGYTKSLASRIAQLRRGKSKNSPGGAWSGEYKILRLCPPEILPKDLERHLHSCYHPYRCNGTRLFRARDGLEIHNWSLNEWFDLPLEALEATIDFVIEHFGDGYSANFWTGQKVSSLLFSYHVASCAYDYAA
jgi:hypothetical protein